MHGWRGPLVAAVAALLGPAAGAAAAKVPSIQVLSTRADLVSGDQALVAISTPRARVRLGTRDITSSFAVRSDGQFEGLVTGLMLGRSVLTAVAPGRRGARLVITDHPIGGPVFSGPQVQPWRCEPGAVDKQCDKPPRYSYMYRSTSPLKSGFQPYDPANPPPDVASTTTDQGVTVPYVIRVETGYEARDQYQIATLFQPGRPWSWAAPQQQWNHKLLITHGASCDVSYQTGTAPSVTSYNPADLLGLPIPLSALPLGDSAEYALSHGFAVLSTALDNSGHNCDVVTQAESLVIAKEHLIDSYGTVRYTIGSGCSGGSLAQQWIANAYPGIYQGILPTCSFPDTWSSASQVMDYHLLLAYFNNSPGMLWLPTQWAAVEGTRCRSTLCSQTSASSPRSSRRTPAVASPTLSATSHRPIPAASAARSPTLRSTSSAPAPNPTGPRTRSGSAAASPVCRSTTLASSTASARCRATRSRLPNSSI
jgi:hypothetical protein